MQGRVTDADRAKQVMAQISSDVMAAHRPDVLGSVVIGHQDGAWTQVIYFTSEAEARVGEKAMENNPAMKEMMSKFEGLAAGPPDFIDLRDPWFDSA